MRNRAIAEYNGCSVEDVEKYRNTGYKYCLSCKTWVPPEKIPKYETKRPEVIGIRCVDCVSSSITAANRKRREPVKDGLLKTRTFKICHSVVELHARNVNSELVEYTISCTTHAVQVKVYERNMARRAFNEPWIFCEACRESYKREIATCVEILS